MPNTHISFQIDPNRTAETRKEKALRLLKELQEIKQQIIEGNQSKELSKRLQEPHSDIQAFSNNNIQI